MNIQLTKTELETITFSLTRTLDEFEDEMIDEETREAMTEKLDSIYQKLISY